jgi:hypothetical protein
MIKLNLPNEKNRVVEYRFFHASELTSKTTERELPLIIAPKEKSDLNFLLAFIRENKQPLATCIHKYGGILFRGFSIASQHDFKSILDQFDYQLETEYSLGATPRKSFGNSIFSSSEATNSIPIIAHNEMSYLNHRPRMIAFYCEVPPVKYGETPIFNCRAALNDLIPEIRETLSTRKVKYVRIFDRGRFIFLNLLLVTWPEAFHTHSRTEVEKICAKFDLDYRWYPGGNLITNNIINPIVKHLYTNEDCLNIQLYHLRNHLLDFENIRPRQNVIWNWILQLSVKMMYWTHLYPIRIRYGDDKPIPGEVVKQIRQSLWDHSVIFSWEKGDVLILDNIATAHGRLNTVPPRKIFTAFGDMYTL